MMKRRNIIICFISVLTFFFFVMNKRVSAQETLINEYPISTDIIYGQPLYTSNLSGGKSSVEGKFVWKEEFRVYDVGEHNCTVKFIPNNELYEIVEMSVKVNVLPRRVYLKFEDDLHKQYDGTDTLNLPSFVIRGIIDKSVYVVGDLQAKLQNVLVNDKVKVELTGLELKGEKKENYYLDLSGFTATIHPVYLEEFSKSKNKVDFDDKTYVPVSSSLKVNDSNDSFYKKKGFVIKDSYDIKIINKDDVVDVDGAVRVKLKINPENLNHKRLHLFNYYNGKYEEVEYSYRDGYIYYNCVGLGNLIIMQKKVNYWWLYMIMFVLASLIVVLVWRNVNIKRKKINRYKSLRRGRDNESY